VVGIYVFVAQCRVGAPASDCVSDALVESVDGGSAVDRTLFAELVLERYEKAPANREGRPRLWYFTSSLLGAPFHRCHTYRRKRAKVGVKNESQMDYFSRSVGVQHPRYWPNARVSPTRRDPFSYECSM
jgi:hypothetical protein